MTTPVIFLVFQFTVGGFVTVFVAAGVVVVVSVGSFPVVIVKVVVVVAGVAVAVTGFNAWVASPSCEVEFTEFLVVDVVAAEVLLED